MIVKAKAALIEQERRTALLKEMTPALQKLVVSFDKRLMAEAKGSIILWYDMGLEIAGALKDTKHYGTNAVEQMAEYESVTPAFLYNMRNVTIAFTRAQITALIERKTATGKHLCFNHISRLANVNKVADRNKLIEDVYTQDMSIAQLESEISAKYAKKMVGHSTGRPPEKPKSLMAGVQDIYKRTHELNGRKKIWNDAVFDVIDELEPDRVTPVLLNKLVQAEVETANLVDHLSKARARIGENIERLKRVLGQSGTPELPEVPAAKPVAKPAVTKAAAKPVAAKPVTKPAAKPVVAKPVVKRTPKPLPPKAEAEVPAEEPLPEDPGFDVDLEGTMAPPETPGDLPVETSPADPD